MIAARSQYKYLNKRFSFGKGSCFFSVLVLAALVSHGLSADNGMVREPLVLQFFKALHCLLPQSQRSDDFSYLLQLKDDYVASYKSSGTRSGDHQTVIKENQKEVEIVSGTERKQNFSIHGTSCPLISPYQHLWSGFINLNLSQ